MATTNQNYVLGLYRELLYRTPTAGELNYYVSRLDSAFFTRPQVAQMFLSAAEYSGEIESVARLYWASFDRVPDYGGLLFWNGILRNGAQFADVANCFVYSPEFVARYGADTSDAAFVKLLYKNALGRSPDAPGEGYWLNALANGMSRGQVLNGFAQSAELAGKLAMQTRAVAAYATMNERSPTAAELTGLPAALETLLVKVAASASGALVWSGNGLQESTANDGSIAGTLLIEASGDTFKGAVGTKLGNVANIPKGLTANLIKTSDSVATLSLTGKATAHDAASSIGNLSVTFTAADFASAKAPSGAARTDLAVDFVDMLLYISGTKLSASIAPNLTLTVDLLANSLKLGSAVLTPIGGTMSSVVDVDFGAIPAATTSTTTKTTTKTTTSSIVFKGGPEANKYVASPLGDSITGGGGDDTITLGAGIDTVVLPAAAGSGVTQISGFTAGSGGDVLKLSPFLTSTKTANLAVIDTNVAAAATPKAWGNGDVLLAIGMTSLSVSDVAGLFGTYLAAPTTARKAVMLTADVTGDTKVWYITNSSGAGVGTIDSSEVVQIATLVGLNNLELAGFAGGNFL